MTADTDTDTGHPLPAEAVRMILLRHTSAVPRELHAPNGLTPIVNRTPDVLAYDPRTGHRRGSLATREIADHADTLVCLSTRRGADTGRT